MIYLAGLVLYENVNKGEEEYMKKEMIIMISAVLMCLIMSGCKNASPVSNQVEDLVPSISISPTEAEKKVEEESLHLLAGFEDWEKTEGIKALNKVLVMEATLKEVVAHEGSSDASEFKEYYLDDMDHFLDYLFTSSMWPEQYAIVDLDHDGTPEVIVSLKQAEETWLMLLRYYDGGVYGYPYDIRAFQYPKTNGNYMASSGALDNQILELSFEGFNIKEKVLGYSTLVNDSGEYYINDEKVSKKDYMNYLDQFHDSEDVKWYSF